MAEFKSYQEVNVINWMNDSRSYLPNAYDFKKGNLSEEYADANSVIIEKLILKAGIRLAAVLNQAFAG